MRAAALFAQLPRESRVVQRAQPDALWDEHAHILRLIEYDLQAIHYALIGGKGPKPEPLPTPAQRAERESAIERAIEGRAEVDAALRDILPGRG